MGLLPLSVVRPASAQEKENIPLSDVPIEQRRSICTHCAVGCGVIAEIQNDVWTGQKPDFESPINLGAHCAKGASFREHGFGSRRLKFPMKLVNGSWQRFSWQQAIDEIGDKLLEIRKTSGSHQIFIHPLLRILIATPQLPYRNRLRQRRSPAARRNISILQESSRPSGGERSARRN